jgi:hypothetical protein
LNEKKDFLHNHIRFGVTTDVFIGLRGDLVWQIFELGKPTP